MKYSAACLAALAASGVVLADGPTNDELAELRLQVEQLHAQIEAMNARDDDWLNQQRSEEVAAVVEGVLADADLRASLLQDNRGPKVSGQLMFRYAYSIQDDAPGTDTNRSGFEMRRAKIKVSGDFNDRWGYSVTGQYARLGSDFSLDQGYITYDMGGGWSAKLGQYKAPFLREELVSSSRQLAAERSLVNEQFNQDRTEGIQIGWAGDDLRWWASFDDGVNADGISSLVTSVEYAGSARIEYLASGTWNQFKDFTSRRGNGNGLLLGAAVLYQKGESGTPTPEFEDLRVTADVSWEGDGFNVFGSYVYQNLDDAGPLDGDRNAFVIQGGYYIADNTEIFARYEWGDIDLSNIEDLSVVTVGFNRYFDGHKLKWTTDVGYGVNEVQLPWVSSGANYRPDSAGQDGQLVIRSQLQLLF